MGNILRYSHNILLSLLPERDINLLDPYAERVTLSARERLEWPSEPIRYVYFIESGLASVISRMKDGKDIEIDMIGREGMSGTGLILDDDRASLCVVMQLSGSAIRIAAKEFLEALVQSPGLHALLLRYVQATVIQKASTAVAIGRASLEERLARWILMCLDRTEENNLALTHESLSIALGVRRPGVTVALHGLQGKGYIRSERGRLSVMNRKGLEALAINSYGIAEREYQRLLGVPGTQRTSAVVTPATIIAASVRD